MNEKYENQPKKIWKRADNPYRSLVFWGWNNKNEPSFLILYGIHNFLEENEYFDENHCIRFENILCDDVTYTNYVVYDGMEGHLPSFETIKILIDYENENDLYICHKENTKYTTYYSKWVDKYLVKNQTRFKKETGITIPYFEQFTYEKLVEKVINSGIEFKDFKFAKNPNEVINLSEDLKQYYELLCTLMSNKNINTRKKKLLELINSNPDKTIYEYIFKLGSVELLSGLFLECAKKEIPLFIDKAKDITKEDLYYANKPYMNGLKRCANIYLNSLDKEKKSEREDWINKNISKMDLNLIKIYNREISEDEVLDGAKYRQYALDGAYYGAYYRSEFKVTAFNNGLEFDIPFFKNFLQEAECYNMPEIIGKIAYYIDAPRIHFYFLGKSMTRELNYFKRYIRRILFDYAKNDENKFMVAVKALLTSYTENDFLCSFKDNFQFNYFIKNILYYNFNKKAPSSYFGRQNWIENDQLLAHRGRYEFMPKIWNNHLDIVLDIAANTKVKTIAKACYFILKDNKNIDKLLENLNYKNLMKLAINNYKPLADMFKEILNDKLNNEEEFDFKIMIELMNSEDEYLNELSTTYFKNKNGHISPNELVNFILDLDLNKYSEFIILNIQSIKTNEYIDFVKGLINNNDLFNKNSFTIPENINDELSLLVNKIKDMTKEEKSEVLKFILSSILEKGSMESFIENFLEESIFAFSYDEIKLILKDFEFNHKNNISSKNNMTISLINSIINDEVPSDSAIINILEMGMSKTLNILFELIEKNEKDILNRYSTLLILFECDIIALNKKAEEIFDKLNKENQNNLLKIIIDSPVEKVYTLALNKIKLLYNNYIPSYLVMQMMEHTSEKVKGYILNKSDNILNTLGKGDEDLFIHYAKTLLLLPNKVRKNKESIYDALYQFTIKYKNNYNNDIEIENDYLKIEQLLFNMGSSNIIKDKEKALVTLAKIKTYKQSLIEEVSLNASKI